MPEQSRIIEVDLGRVMAIVLMIAYHAAYDLGVLYHRSIDVYHGAWKIVGEASAVLFLLLVGISFTLSWERTPEASRYVKKGLRVLFYGVLVSAVTYVTEPNTYVRFGILHLIGISMMLLPLVPRSAVPVFIFAALCIGAGALIAPLQWDYALLLPFGVKYAGFRSVDFYPIFPWTGVILLGTLIGHRFIALGKPTLLKLPAPLRRVIEAVSKHSLFIYMVHQPVLLLLLRWTLR